ncbi:MerR family DNA-binding transcriptional regulator [Micrococcus luteus]|uniref:MerR family DNA-binding transcriptional regulator n=2 Tax=Micrococcus luteus TaxID=1270 RepID=UPI001CA674E5|nr:MerR family DNA-binding transcriptional regulator [Micrococcus luteus]QZY84072.1 MerR family DNA-binding transcriptional regulator [Micrococcus luteus]
MRTLMTIGEFAAATGLSVKALRFYDEHGLLTPVDVDPQSGYRRYAPRQVRTAGVPAEDVKLALEHPDRLPSLLEEHPEGTRRRRDLEDRALALAGEFLTPDDAPSVQEREAPATAWVGVVVNLLLDGKDMGGANSEANDQFAAVWHAAAEAGLRPSGPMLTAMRPGGDGPDSVAMVLAIPVEGEVPASFAVPGMETVAATLPRRIERYATFHADAANVDLLQDAPGGPLPHPSLVALMEAFDEDEFAETELRQILVDPSVGHIELAATLRVLEG